MGIRKRNLFILLLIIIVTTVGIMFVSISNNNQNSEEVKTTSEPMDINFADNYISYVLEKESTLQFNLFGAQDVSIDGPSYFDAVNFISLENENVEIVDYEISEGDVFDNQQLFNLILEVKLNSEETEEATELTLHYNNDEKVSFSFGTLILKDDNGFNQVDLDVTGDNNTLAAPLPSLDANLLNQTEEDVVLSRVYDLGENLTFSFDKEVILEDGEIENIAITELDETTPYDFYTITPIIEFEIDSEVNEYFMPGVVYGVMEEDDVKMQRILEN